MTLRPLNESTRQIPAWPTRVIELARVACAVGDPGTAEASLAQLWMLINSALRQGIRWRSRRLGPVSAEDIEDLAANKSLELLRALDGRTWSPSTSSAAEVAAFISTVARNALIDHLRRSRKGAMVPMEDLDDEALERIDVASPISTPGECADRQRFVDALRACAAGLSHRDRMIWFFRVLYELPTRRIASHPEVGLKPAHVDVILQRCRKTIGACMRAKGASASEVPAGAFAAIWEAFRFEVLSVPDGGTHG